jgi:predicted nucleotidyltransferase
MNKSIPSKDYQAYKKFWDLDALKQAADLEDIRQNAVAFAKSAAGVLSKTFGATRVVLFGSVMEPGRFNRRSDIDLAVDGLPSSRYFAALGELMRTSPFSIDLVPIEEANPLMKERIAKGVVLYE